MTIKLKRKITTPEEPYITLNINHYVDIPVLKDLDDMSTIIANHQEHADEFYMLIRTLHGTYTWADLIQTNLTPGIHEIDEEVCDNEWDSKMLAVKARLKRSCSIHFFKTIQDFSKWLLDIKESES